MGRKVVTVLLLVGLSMALAGCTGEERIGDHRLSGPESEETFTVSVPEGTKRLRIEISTKGSPASEGSVEFMLAQGPAGVAYIASLEHGQERVGYVDDPRPGNYFGIIDYEGGYEGPASMQVYRTESAGVLGIGGSFWDILGVILAAATLAGGWFLYRHHTSKLNREMERIDETFKELRTDVEACKHELNDMQEDLRRQLVQRRLKESHYLILEKRIERYLGDLERLGQRVTAAGGGDTEVPLDVE